MLLLCCVWKAIHCQDFRVQLMGIIGGFELIMDDKNNQGTVASTCLIVIWLLFRIAVQKCEINAMLLFHSMSTREHSTHPHTYGACLDFFSGLCRFVHTVLDWHLPRSPVIRVFVWEPVSVCVDFEYFDSSNQFNEIIVDSLITGTQISLGDLWVISLGIIYLALLNGNMIYKECVCCLFACKMRIHPALPKTLLTGSPTGCDGHFRSLLLSSL